MRQSNISFFQKIKKKSLKFVDNNLNNGAFLTHFIKQNRNFFWERKFNVKRMKRRTVRLTQLSILNVISVHLDIKANECEVHLSILRKMYSN